MPKKNDIAFFLLCVSFLLFQQDLIDDLKYELTGKFERLIVSLMRAPAYHDAKEIHDAIQVSNLHYSMYLRSPFPVILLHI